MVMYKISDSQKRAPSPIRNSSEKVDKAEAAQSGFTTSSASARNPKWTAGEVRSGQIWPSRRSQTRGRAGLDERCTTGSPATTRRRTSVRCRSLNSGAE